VKGKMTLDLSVTNAGVKIPELGKKKKFYYGERGKNRGEIKADAAQQQRRKAPDEIILLFRSEIWKENNQAAEKS